MTTVAANDFASFQEKQRESELEKECIGAQWRMQMIASWSPEKTEKSI
jgi:hypothetical protein